RRATSVYARAPHRGAAARARPRVGERRCRRRSPEPDRRPGRVPFPPALPDRAGAVVLDGGSGALGSGGPRRGLSLRVARAAGAAHARGPPGGAMIERRTFVFNDLEHPAFEATGAHDGPRLSLIAGVHGCEYSSIAAVMRFVNELDTS